MYIQRHLSTKLLAASKEYQVLSIFGPRQTGKTTLVQKVFAKHKYITLEDFDNRDFANTDPRGFINQYTNDSGIILDEVQNTPKLLSYIQGHVDSNPKAGRFILTGSHNLLLNQNITQTLAGRTAIFSLLPLSIAELHTAKMLPDNITELLFKGLYPKLYSMDININDWYNNYLLTYIERDVRLIKNITDLSLFRNFIKLCAGRIGQVVNYNSLGNDCGVDLKTAKSWLNILEASYIITRLQPYHNNFNKRIIKSPKLYFCDTGVACALLGIEDSKQLDNHYLKGGIFENIVIQDLIKQRYNMGKQNNCYYFRDQSGFEVDCIREFAGKLQAVEIKAGQTIQQNFLKNLDKAQQLFGVNARRPCLVYGGYEDQKRTNIDVIAWRNLGLSQH